MNLDKSIKISIVVMICSFVTIESHAVTQETQKPTRLKSVVESNKSRPANSFQQFGNFKAPPPVSQNVPVPPSGWLFRMKDGSLVMGELSEPITIKVKSRHGEFTVSSEDLVSLRMVAGANENQDSDAEKEAGQEIVVATNSGDIVSGICELQPVKIELSWGEALINPDSLDFISFRDGSASPKTISRATHGGQGWILTPVQIVHREHRVGNSTYAVHVQSPGQLLTAPKRK